MPNLKKSFLMGTAAAGAARLASSIFFILAVNAACTNPSTIPSGFAAPCPVFSLSSTSITQSQTLTLSATPQAGTDYLYTTAYVSQGTTWNAYTLIGNNAYPAYSSALASLTLSSTQLQSLSLGTHYAVVWDWLWDATANCYKGPGLNQCNTGAWRVQSFSLTSSTTPTPTPTATPTYTYSQASYYVYSQAPYYAYSQSAYTGGTNVAPQGTAYLWHANAASTANTNRLAAPGLSDNNLTVDVNLNGGTPESGLAYEAGGVIWSTAQSIASVKFINGWESSGDGSFDANLTLQTTTDGTTWVDSPWIVSPAYPYFSSAVAGQTYTFSGTAVSVRGVRVSGQVRTAPTSSYWEDMREVQAFTGGGTYAYSQSAYYAYSQATYTSYTYSQSSYYAYSQSAYYAYSQAAYTGGTIRQVGSGQTYATIQACANTAVAGDTCNVHVGTYSGWTQPVSGSSGNRITFTANPGDTVTINSTVDISSRSYITISHFTFSGAGVSGNGTSSHNIIDHNNSNTTMLRIIDGQGSAGSDNIMSNNVIVFPNHSNNATCFYVYGDRNRFENNDCSGGGGDFLDWGGTNVVVRNNKFHDIDGSLSGEHMDFFQVIGGGTVPTGSFSLSEGNVEYNCLNDGGNCHNVIIRTGGAGGANGADTIIVRFNYAHDIDGSGASFGGVGDNVPNSAFYNNTYATFTATGSANCASYQNAPAGEAFNNICYNLGTAGQFQVGGCNSSGLTGVCNGNLLFDTGYTGSWDSVYSGEATYAALHNQNPQFANYPTDGTLQAGSPAIGAGVALTTASGSGSNSTSLAVGNAHGFQPGWAGVQADWIRIGASTAVQISSINYSTNVITLASPVTWASGAPIYLYKNSNGTVVLPGNAPNVGAY